MSDDQLPIEIVGGAGPRETAAIMTVVAQLAIEEAAASAAPTSRPRQSSWVLAWRPRQNTVPLPSHTYNAMPWSEVEQATDSST